VIIVFDFDGTLADSEPVVADIYDEFAAKNKWPTLTHEEYYRLKNGTVHDAMRWAGVRFWQLPKLIKLGRRQYRKRQDEIKIFDAMPQVVKQLAKGNKLYVLSSNSRQTVANILARHDLSQYLTILKTTPLFGKHKVLKKLGEKQGDCWMIGDETRDIEAAKRAKFKSIAVTWGLQSPASIEQSKPDYIARRPSDIVKYIQPS
jgi:phosphoglycolate phosphatase